MAEVPGSILMGGNILLLDFLFSRSKVSDPNIANSMKLNEILAK